MMFILVMAGTAMSEEAPLDVRIENVYSKNQQHEMVTVVELTFSRPVAANEHVVFDLTYTDVFGNVIYRGTASTQFNMEGREHIFYLLECGKTSGLAVEDRPRIEGTEISTSVETGGVYSDSYVMEEIDLELASVSESFLYDDVFTVIFSGLEGRAKHTRGAIFLLADGKGEPTVIWGFGEDYNSVNLTLSFDPKEEEDFETVYLISGINVVEKNE
jgi:hypothetical protein